MRKRRGIRALWNAILQLNPDDPDTLVNKGAALYKLKRYTEAMAVWDEVVRRYGEAAEPGIREVVAKALVNKGATLHELKRYTEARQAFEKAAALGLEQAGQALEVLKQEGH